MDLRKLFPLCTCLAIAGLVGCVTSSKPAHDQNEKIKAAAASPEPGDVIPPGLTPKFLGLLTGEGLSATPAQMGEASKVTAAWNNKIVFAPDPTRGGDPMPSLIVRLWLFGPDEGTPVAPDGELLVALWDNMPKSGSGKPELKELWHIDRETAMKFRKRDAIGDGYTLLLPWSNYNIDVKQVNLVVRFNGADGRSVASAPEKLSIDHSATLQKAQERLGISTKSESFEKLPTPALRPWPETK
ncbi:MAG: hypothetical protein EXS09_04475 [Gemmataceae bacterium]|nr:hypothetical protein [Gemmataceae bacterium]